jgi:membrane protein CcdC involved in cytochrome C biogenesis
MPDKVRKQRFIFLAILLLALFSYPLISLADRNRLTGSFPVLFVYIFLVWGVSIILLYRNAEKRDTKNKTGP